MRGRLLLAGDAGHELRNIVASWPWTMLLRHRSLPEASLAGGGPLDGAFWMQPFWIVCRTRLSDGWI